MRLAQQTPRPLHFSATPENLQLLMYCTCDDADTTDLLAYTWAGVGDQRVGANQWQDPYPSTAATWVITSNRAVLTGAAGSGAAYVYDVGAAASEIKATLNSPAPASVGEVGIILRSDGLAGSNNYWSCILRYDGTAGDYIMRINKVAGGIAIPQGTDLLLGATPFPSGARTLVVTDDGNTISMYFEDAPGTVHSFTDSQYYGGTFIGLRGLCGVGAGWAGSTAENISVR